MLVRGFAIALPLFVLVASFGACAGSSGEGIVGNPSGNDGGGASSSGGSAGSSSGSSNAGSSSGITGGSSSGSANGSSSGTTSGSSSGSANGSSSGTTSGSSSGGSSSCGCNGAPNCAVWDNVLVTWYGYNDNSGSSEQSYGSSAIAYPAPQDVNTTDVAGNSVTHPNAGNIKHTVATEGAGTYDDPITAASSADSDPACASSSLPVHKFLSQGGVTLSPGTIIYNPVVQKYFIMEDSCLECGDEYMCQITDCPNAPDCSDMDDGTPPSPCPANTFFHIDFWMGPSSASDGMYADALQNCEDNATGGDGSQNMQWDQPGRWPIVVNPPPDLPVASGPIFSGTGQCFTQTQVTSVTCQ